MKPAYYESGIPVFTGSSFFKPSEAVYIQMSTDYPDFVGKTHKHRFIELVYVLSGKATHCINNERYEVRKGSLIIINYEAAHVFFEDKTYGEPFVTYDLMFTPGFIDVSLISRHNFNELFSSFIFYSICPEQREIGPDLLLTGASYNIFRDMFNRIYNEYTNKNNSNAETIRTCVVELIINIFKQLDSKAKFPARKQQEKIVDRALDYLYEHYGSRITLDELSAHIFLNKDYFTRLFREITGKPVSALLQEIRIDEACRMLTSTKLPIAEISDGCGYPDIKFFYVIFRKLTGMTPGEYRKGRISHSSNRSLG